MKEQTTETPRYAIMFSSKEDAQSAARLLKEKDIPTCSPATPLVKGPRPGSRVSSFWLITKPTHPETTVEDILAETNVRELAFMVKGGLDPQHIDGIYLDSQEAGERARKIMESWRTFQATMSEAG